VDDALLRRLVTIPHFHVFQEKDRDRGMVEKLLAEKDAIFSLLVDEMRNYREDGLIQIPDHWKEGQAQLLAGDAMFTYISESYTKTDGSTIDLRIAMRVIESKYIEWCQAAMIDCPTVMKPSGFDAWGNTLSVERLNCGGARNLHKAFKAMGYDIKTYSGAPYVWCKMKGS